MSQRIVGFYNNMDTAERVKDDLINAGFDRGDVGIFSGREGPSFWHDVKDFFGVADEEDRALYAEAARRGSTAVAVTLDDAEAANQSRATQIMQKYNPIDLNRQAEQWRAQGWKGHQASTAPAGASATGVSTTATRSIASAERAATTQPASAQGRQVVPVVEEQLNVGKRQVLTGGLRVHTQVTQKPVEAQVQLREEHVSVERRPVDRPIATGEMPFQDRTIEVTESAEQPIINKQARVVEEVVVGKTAAQRTQTVRDTVKRTDVQVEKIAPEQGQFADQFASEVAADQRYRGRDWNTLEPEVRGSFEQRYPGRKWEQFKDAVHRGYEKARQKV